MTIKLCCFGHHEFTLFGIGSKKSRRILIGVISIYVRIKNLPAVFPKTEILI